MEELGFPGLWARGRFRLSSAEGCEAPRKVLGAALGSSGPKAPGPRERRTTRESSKRTSSARTKRKRSYGAALQGLRIVLGWGRVQGLGVKASDLLEAGGFAEPRVQ